MQGTFASVAQSLTWLDQQRGALEGLVAELVCLDSHTGDAAGVERVVAVLEPELGALGLATERIAAPPFGPHLAFRGPAAGAPVFLVGHTDTVFPPGSFSGLRVEGDHGHGPGAFDMKGGLAVMLFGLAAAHRAGLLDRVPLAGLLVSDEEVGSPSSQPHLRRLAAGARARSVFESGRAGDLLVTRRKGTAAVPGGGPRRGRPRRQRARQGEERHLGAGPLRRPAPAAHRPRARPHRQRRHHPRRHHQEHRPRAGRVRGRPALPLRRRRRAAGEALRRGLRRGGASRGRGSSSRPTSWRDPLERTAASAALAAAYGACQRASGLGVGEAPLVGGGSDACTTGAIGIPSIDGLGPRGAGFHTREERVELASLVPKAQAFLRYLAGLAG